MEKLKRTSAIVNKRKKLTKSLVVIIMLGFIINCSSCTKYWNCSGISEIMFVRGTDTVYIDPSLQSGYYSKTYSSSFYNDLVNYYQQQGYAVISLESYEEVIYDKTRVKAYEKNGEKCEEVLSL